MSVVTHQHSARCTRPHGGAVFATRHVSFDQRATRTHAKVTHPYAALAFCTAGRVQTEQHGCFRVEAGDVVLVPAGTPHRTLAADPHELWGVGFAAGSFAADDGGALLAPFERVRAGASAVVRVPEERRAFLASLCAELHDVVAARGADAVQRSLLTLIVHEVARAVRLAEAPDDHPSSNVVAASLAVIERRCLSRLTLRDVATAVGRSPAYVTTALRRETGRSAIAWITAGRMAEARRLLLHSDEPVEVIAGRVGYADVTHFIRTFRRTHGTTPSAWRGTSRTYVG
jgi:AraC family transcriptional activator of pobA